MQKQKQTDITALVLLNLFDRFFYGRLKQNIFFFTYFKKEDFIEKYIKLKQNINVEGTDPFFSQYFCRSVCHDVHLFLPQTL